MPTDEEIEQYIERLKAHRRTLALYLQQRAEFGNAFLPPHIAHGIVEARGNIASIKRTLRDWGVDVEDHPDDEDVIIEQTKKLGTKLSKVPQLLVACSVLLFSILFLVNIFTNRRSAESVVGTPQRETNLSTALSTISSSNEEPISSTNEVANTSSAIQAYVTPSLIPTSMPLLTTTPGSIPFSSTSNPSELNRALQWRQGGSKESRYYLDKGLFTLISGPSTDQWSKRDDAALLSFPITGNFDVQVRVIFDPSKNYQSAGLGIRSANDPLTWIRITRSYFDGQVVGVGKTVQGVSTPFTPVNYGSDTIYLRIERRGEFVTLSYHGEGKNWIALEKDHEIKLSEKVEIYLITYSTDTFAGATAQFSDLSILPAG